MIIGEDRRRGRCQRGCLESGGGQPADLVGPVLDDEFRRQYEETAMPAIRTCRDPTACTA